MGHQIIKQPNGLYALWSSIVDNFIIVDATIEEITEDQIKWEIESITEKITTKNKKVAAQLEAGEKPYYQFTHSWEDALEIIKEVHGKKEVKELLKMLNEDKYLDKDSKK